ncbi:MAG: ATP-dependent sacrificial sulfur transferase LarE [Anaerolineae bacterium]
MDSDLALKEQRLFEIIGAMPSVAIAFSGGVDSSYLLSACIDTLGAERVEAITVDSPLLPRPELHTAREIARLVGARHRIVPVDELQDPDISANPPDRCYYCKRLRFQELITLADSAMPGRVLLHGENADDHLDYRPGSRAAVELGVRAPLAEAGLTKADIRVLSRQRGLPTWDHPAEACLATRFPSGTALTAGGLERVERAENALHTLLGIGGLRVRDHYPLARIELPAEQIARIAEYLLRERVVAALREAGYRYVTVDLSGYRKGSMNDQPAERRSSE